MAQQRTGAREGDAPVLSCVRSLRLLRRLYLFSNISADKEQLTGTTG